MYYPKNNFYISILMFLIQKLFTITTLVYIPNILKVDISLLDYL